MDEMKIKTKAGVKIFVVDDFGPTISFDKPVRALGLTRGEAKRLGMNLLKISTRRL